MNQLVTGALGGSNFHERRGRRRETLVLRIGIVETKTRATICLVRNISAEGVQVKTFSSLKEGDQAVLRVGDELGISACVVWSRDQFAGLKFHGKIPREALLRLSQKRDQARRRSSPRIETAACAVLRSGGRTYTGLLRDISTTGAKVQTNRTAPSNGPAILELPNMPQQRCFIRWSEGQEVGVSFAAPLSIEIIAVWLEERSYS
ncbi:PilZ domain-containing protein [Sphingomonas arenae]|uniref:PilZ domain-containing protein n=1 Tax=Sphingomonas arenae TaxID=2812555 RepID=UPI001968901B